MILEHLFKNHPRSVGDVPEHGQPDDCVAP